jgi:hypothetical protein
MINLVKAKVAEVTYKDENITKLKVQIDSSIYFCINYNQLTGYIETNDEVMLNTTAIELKLGSGGYHFVLFNLTRGGHANIGEGHIMKLRYTPMQINCMAVESQESIYHEVFNYFESLDNIPVIIGTLHSMLTPIALTLNILIKKTQIVYIMTDGGALPIWISDAVKRLCDDGILYKTITYGNAFGGDLECINIYSALIAAREILNADAVIVCMGPGIAGTDTSYGFSGIEQSHIIDAVNNLSGKAIAVPRISFSDNRSRHYGLSHHTRMTLGKLCFTRAFAAFPELEQSKAELLEKQLIESSIVSKHNISYWKAAQVEKLLEQEAWRLVKMGKGYFDDKEYFITCGLAAMLV